MYNYKLEKDEKKNMERELRNYWENKKKLKNLELQIIEEGSATSGQPHNNTNSNPTERKALKLMSTRSILYCQERVRYVENVITRLKPFEKKIFEQIFKYSHDFIYCETNFNISRSTYYNIYNKCIYYLAEEWGII